jgi:hypothetical protein
MKIFTKKYLAITNDKIDSATKMTNSKIVETNTKMDEIKKAMDSKLGAMDSKMGAMMDILKEIQKKSE